MDFHGFYFELEKGASPCQTTIVSPKVRFLGDDVAVVTYIRLTQHLAADSEPKTSVFEETRVWQRQNGRWQHVHFHRSDNR